MHREITKAQARDIIKVLREECGYKPDPYETENFILAVTTVENDRACAEYRFMGAIGSGGKFRNNGNHNNTPYVDCYSENETPERSAMIERANQRLAVLFRPAHAEPHPSWKPDDKSDRHPQTIEEWDYQKDPFGSEALQRAIRRLNVSGDLSDPRVPDQMAMVRRLDLLRLLGSYTHRNAVFELWVSRRPVPVADWTIVVDQDVLIYVVHPNAEFEKDEKVRQEKWENWTVGRWINHNGGGWTYFGMMGTVTHVAPLPGRP